jgi:hypothetical protein
MKFVHKVFKIHFLLHRKQNDSITKHKCLRLFRDVTTDYSENCVNVIYLESEFLSVVVMKIHYYENGGEIFFRNVASLLTDCMELYLKR